MRTAFQSVFFPLVTTASRVREKRGNVLVFSFLFFLLTPSWLTVSTVPGTAAASVCTGGGGCSPLLAPSDAIFVLKRSAGATAHPELVNY